MPHNPRATFFFSDGAYSWTETYYMLGAYDDLSLPEANAKKLADLRTMMLPSYSGDFMAAGGGPSLDELRVSFDDVWRDSRIRVDTRRGAPGAKYNKELEEESLERPEVPYSTVLVRLEAGDKYRRPLYMSAVPQRIIRDPAGPQTRADPAWHKAWVNFEKELVKADGVWGFKVALKNGDGVVEKPIQNVVYAGNTATVQCQGHGLPATDVDGNPPTCIIRGVVNSPRQKGCNGRRLYTIVNGNTFTVQFDPVGNDPVTYVKGGLVRLLKYEVRKITAIDAVGQTHRKRGVRSGRPLGRSRNRT